MEENEYGGGPEPKEQPEQEEPGQLVFLFLLTAIYLTEISQLEGRRRKTGEMTEAGGRKAREVSEAAEVGAVREDEE